MNGIFTYIWLNYRVDVSKYTTHGSYVFFETCYLTYKYCRLAIIVFLDFFRVSYRPGILTPQKWLF